MLPTWRLTGGFGGSFKDNHRPPSSSSVVRERRGRPSRQHTRRRTYIVEIAQGSRTMNVSTAGHGGGRQAYSRFRLIPCGMSCASAHPPRAHAMPSDRSKAWVNAGGKGNLEMREIWATLRTVPAANRAHRDSRRRGRAGHLPCHGYQIIGDENPLTVCSPASLPRTERPCPLRWEKYMTVVFITGRLCEKDASTTSRQGRQGFSITEHQRRTGQRRREEIVTSSHLHHAKSRPPSDVVVLADPTPSATTDLARGRHARNHSRDLHHHPGRGGGDGGHSLTSRRRAREEKPHSSGAWPHARHRLVPLQARGLQRS